MYLFRHVVYWPCLALSTSLKIDLFPRGQQGITRHVIPLSHVVSWPCLASTTHSRIYLFPPWVVGNDASHSTPFACGLLALWATASPTHSRIYSYHAKWEPPTWLVVTKMGNHTSERRRHKDRIIIRNKDGVITNIIAQGQTHIKNSQVKCIQNIWFSSK